MKIGAFFLILSALANTASSAIIKNFLLDYMSQIEHEMNPPDDVKNIFIYVDYQDEFKLYKDQENSNESVWRVIVHENHYKRLKIVCKNSWETVKTDIQTPFHCNYLIVDCKSVQEKTNPNKKYIRGALFMIVALFCLIAWKMKKHTFDDFKAFFTDRYRRWRNPVAPQYAYFHNESEERQQPVIINLDSQSVHFSNVY